MTGSGLKKEKMARAVGGEGGDYFKYFHQRGAIIQGRRLIEGRLLFEEIRYARAGTLELLDMSASIKRLFYFLQVRMEV